MEFYILSRKEKLITGVEQHDGDWLDCKPVYNPKNINVIEESIRASEVFNNPAYEVSTCLATLIEQADARV